MYNYSVWPGAYSFKSELKALAKWLREQLDELLLSIEKTESLLR